MASYYVYSGAVGAANGTSWADAYTKLATALSGKSAGDIFYVAHDHSETTASSVTLSSPGSQTNFCKVICANQAGSVPPVAADLRATAVIATSGANNMIINGCTHFDGIIFNVGTSGSCNFIIADDNNNETIRFDNCSLRLFSGGSGSNIYWAGGGGDPNRNVLVELNNTTLSFSHASQKTINAPVLRWRNTPSAILGTVPTVLFQPATGGIVDCEGVDLSAFSGVLVGLTGNASGTQWRFVDCKLNASVTKATTNLSTMLGNGGTEVHFVRTGSSGVNYNIFKQSKTGVLNQETTVVRTGGASDGTTPIAWKVDTSASCSFATPFECPLVAIWNDTTGSSKTATIEGIWGGGAVPNDDEIWVDVRYLGDASSPQASLVSDRKATILSSAAGQASSSETWGGSTTKFKLNVSFTAQQEGWVYARVMCAKASSTFYIDPMVTLT
jgi:hypothetical protein